MDTRIDNRPLGVVATVGIGRNPGSWHGKGPTEPDVIGEEPRFNLPNGDPQFSKFHLFLVQQVQELAGARSVMIKVA